MAYFAELDSNNTVLRVVSISNQFLLDENGNEVEQNGINFCKQLFGQDTTWRKTSYNTRAGQHTEGKIPFRKNYAGIGYTYDAQRDAFIPPKPFQSWLLDEDTCRWKAPVPKPTDIDKLYHWDEPTLSWVEIVE